MSDDTPIRLALALPAATYEALAARAEAHRTDPAALAAELVAEAVGRDPADHPRAATLAGAVNECLAELARLRAEAQGSRAGPAAPWRPDFVGLDFALEQWVRDARGLDPESRKLLHWKLVQACETLAK